MALSAELQELAASLNETLPASGEITYGEWRGQLVQQGRIADLRQFHKMRREGAINVRLDTSGDTPELYVQRNAYPDAGQGQGGGD